MVELSTSLTFVPGEKTYTTYNTRITPVDTITHGLHYWRVSSVDADGHLGTPSSGWSFTKNTDAPVLVSPEDNASITKPTLQWQAVDGAAYYRVELSASPSFLPVLIYDTYNLQITPVDALPLSTYYWRVSGVDAGGHVGNNNWRKFTLNALPVPGYVTPQLLSPPNTPTITTDPPFSWSRVVGAAYYRLIVSKSATFSPIYEFINTDYDSYTPYTAGSFDAYPNGIYYWKVEARNSGGILISTSEARSFTKQEPLPLISPADAVTGLVVDPTFVWNQIVGAKTYRLIVSKYADFSPTYESINTDYDSYTPFTAGSFDAYPNSIYYWKVEARNSGGILISYSEARSFTKQEPLPLITPVNGANDLVTDPTFQWNQIVGAKTYRLIVSKSAEFSPTFDSVICDYNTYTPYTPGTVSTYPGGTYYWKVEALNSGGAVIATSNNWSFSKVYRLYLPITTKASP